jgi:hypothetical protein
LPPRSTGAKKMPEGGRGSAALGAANWLSLAAAPTFAIMALLTSVLGGGPANIICSAAQDASPLSGMVPMYLLMSAFHSAPWLKLLSPFQRIDTIAGDHGSSKTENANG